ncbi:putative phosphoglucomutase [Desulfitobacterium hafniense DP7]|uniref:Phosphoglucomutase n=1 Tax=Desulfitobacterium hafniense DP7 TaxID=537010 RepID=G9XMH6_DESHA|nr:phospho-sugar mutase [Desulfitobacterium hafniense]EHL07152.1 putative phosphoglucomutase [Desulfitobacterium hafniense DP7]
MIQERYRFWLTSPYFDEDTRSEVAAINDEKEIEDRFYTDLEFGTGGLRGVLGAGTNRMNIYVIRKATQGLADLILEGGEAGKNRGVVIAYDSRRFSDRFAKEAALVLAGNGIKAYLFDDLRPTPELSFAVRHLKAQAGLVITASHNPKEYNGYKVYWEDGGQVPPDRGDRILAHIKAHQAWDDILPLEEAEARDKGLLVEIGEEIDAVYLSKVKELALYPELSQAKGSNLSIVYTPLHGAGNVLVNRILTEMGYSVFTVPEQEKPDPEFTTVPYPNPEIPSTFDLARSYGKARNAQMLIATDPDADRLGMALRTPQGDYRQLTGNQVGTLLSYYLLTQKKRLGILPEQAVVIKTIASTDLADLLVKDLGARVENVLTGFKFIAEKEQEMEVQGSGDFQFGFEESYGYLAGHFVRDKDAVIASLLLAEAALYYQEQEGRSLLEVLEDIYGKYGYFIDDQISITLEGKAGKEQMEKMMVKLRETDVKSFGGIAVACIDDYELRKGRRMIEPFHSYELALPQSNVIRYSFQGGGFVMARPSGTEPKIKFYFNIRGVDPQQLQATLENVKKDLLELIKN